MTQLRHRSLQCAGSTSQSLCLASSQSDLNCEQLPCCYRGFLLGYKKFIFAFLGFLATFASGAQNGDCSGLASLLMNIKGNYATVNHVSWGELWEISREAYRIASRESCDFCEMAYRRFKTVAANGGVEVVASPALVPLVGELGPKMLGDVREFDRQAKQWGFRVPNSTRLLFLHRKEAKYDNTSGVFFYRIPVLNIWRQKVQSVTIFEMVDGHLHKVVDQAKSSSVVFHERVHALFHNTYHRRAFIHNNIAFQEALADFLAAHVQGDPRIFPISDEISWRNIKDRTHFVQELTKWGDGVLTSDLSTVSEFTIHANSLLISNVLWEVRQYLGPDRMSAMLKPLIDNLNRYRASFEDQYTDFEALRGLSGTAENPRDYLQYVDYRDRFKNDLAYFFAVLKNTARETGDGIRIERVIKDLVDEWNFYPNRIDQVAGNIRKGEDTFVYDETAGKASYRRMLLRSHGFFAIEGGTVLSAGGALGYIAETLRSLF